MSLDAATNGAPDAQAPHATARVDAIDALLPQTQCRQCTYAGCRPYAEAIARGEAAINQCPPGGAAGIAALARLLGCEPLPLSAAHGVEKPPLLAVIDEARCIGCTKCIAACPVDAIVGAAKRMHAVIEAECTGCELCLAPCPVDCIALVPAAAPTAARAAKSRERHRARLARTERIEAERVARLAVRTEAALAPAAAVDPVAAALARAAARRAARTGG